MAFEIVRLTDAPDRVDAWRRAVPAIDAHPLSGGFGRSYYPLVYEERRRDESFAVVGCDGVALLVQCTAGDGALDWYGMPIVVLGRPESPLNTTAFLAALNHMERIVLARNIRHWAIREPSDWPACAFREWATTRHFNPSPWETAICDLSLDETGLHRFLRRSFRSLVNWGRRSLRMEFLGNDNIDPALFSRYRAFHHDVAGHVTRADASWTAMYKWIIGGRGEIAFGHLDDRLVSATMTVDGARTAYYASAVYDRSLFADKKPLAHWPLWLSILRAKERGMRLFDLGHVPLEGQASAKEVQIAFFKRGFASDIRTETLWTWRRA